MPVIEVIPQKVEHFPTACIRKLHVERDCNRGEAVNVIKDLNITGSHNRFYSFVVRFVEQYPAKAQIIFYYQHYFVVWLNVASIVTCFVNQLADYSQVF